MTGQRIVGFAAIVFALTVPASQRASAGDEETALGAKIANLHFKDIHYLPRSLDDFGKKKAFVLVFTNTTCPVVQRYMPALAALEKEYRGKDVQFIAVNVGADDSILQVAGQAVRFEMEFPFVKDADLSCADVLGVTRTPGIAVLDGERRLRYRGRIDDQHRLGGSRASPTEQPLKDALDALLAGKEI